MREACAHRWSWSTGHGLRSGVEMVDMHRLATESLTVRISMNVSAHADVQASIQESRDEPGMQLVGGLRALTIPCQWADQRIIGSRYLSHASDQTLPVPVPRTDEARNAQHTDFAGAFASQGGGGSLRM